MNDVPFELLSLLGRYVRRISSTTYTCCAPLLLVLLWGLEDGELNVLANSAAMSLNGTGDNFCSVLVYP